MGAQMIPEPPIGSIVVDASGGWPWVRTAGGEWTRDAGRTFLSWDQVYAWHQQAVDDPDDETVDPFTPVVLVSGVDKTGWETCDSCAKGIRPGIATVRHPYNDATGGGIRIYHAECWDREQRPDPCPVCGRRHQGGPSVGVCDQ